jgi:hypothetical protein
MSEAAAIARRGADRLGDLQRSAVSVIGDARAAGFTVGEDLSVSDHSALPVGPALAARQAQAEQFAASIRTHAMRLSLADNEVAANIAATLAPLAEIRFAESPDLPTPSNGPAGPEETRTVQALDVKKSPAGSSDPAGSGDPSGLLEKVATGRGINDAPLSESNPLSVLFGGGADGAKVTDRVTGGAQDASADATRSPLAAPLVRADPSVVSQQRARVDSARQALDTAQAKLDAAAAQTYTQGGAAGPLRGDTEKLSQAVFDARRELTTQTKILTDLNTAAAENGIPTAPVPALPDNADVQAFPQQPSAFAQGSRALSDGSLGLIPDVAKDVDIFTNWGEHSGSEQAGAVLDAAGMVPIPGAKALAEGLAHGADALNAGHHATGALDDLAGAGQHVAHAGDGVAAHHGGDIPGGVHPGAGGPGNWLPVNESMSPRSAAYQEQITGHPIGTGYVVDGVKFDTFSNGVLTDAKGYYKQFVENGEWKDFFTGDKGLIKQANDQIRVANGTPIQWVFAEPEVASVVEKMFKNEGIYGIAVGVIPPK